MMCKEIVFHNKKIAKLMAALEIQDKLQGLVMDQKYIRNELVTALIYRCMVATAAASNSEVYGTSVLCEAVNVQPFIDPPLSATGVGNFLTLNHIPASMESETKLNSFVNQIGKGKMQLRGKKSMDKYELTTSIIAEYAKHKKCTFIDNSMCNFPVYDGLDFGCGRPVKVTVLPLVDYTILMDTPSGDGMIIVGLEEQDMQKFLAQKELLTYASL